MIEYNTQNNKRIDILHRKHYKWLYGVTFKITRSKEETEDLISELYIYLLEKGNPRIWYLDSFNLMYCRTFLHTRWINNVKRAKRITITDTFLDGPDEEYNYDEDYLMDQTYDEVMIWLKELEKTPYWASTKLFTIYMFNDYTMDEISKLIGISKSTTFLNVKKIKTFLKTKIENPFK